MDPMSEDLDLPPGYPVRWEADVVLRDGSVAHLRPILPSDVDLIHAFHSRQSDESIYLRFFAPLRQLSDRDVHRFTHVDYEDRVALVMTLREDIIGIGRYDLTEPASAEVAFNVSDDHQGKGIGSVLLEHLAAVAQEFGITRFTAEVLPQNRKMLTVFSEAGYEVSRKVEDGVVALHFDIEPTDRSKAVATSREHRAEAISVSRILRPRSVAVIGAGRSAQSMGHHFLKNLLDAGFTGEVHPVNRKARTILGRPAYDSIGDVPGPVDLAVVAVPADKVLKVVDECAAAGVGALLVVSSGFGEGGGEGDELQAELVRRVRGSGMRIVGPNSFGLINTDDAFSLNASLSPTMPPSGHLGLFSQSGALGIAVLQSAARRNLGISTFASAGNRVDVSGNDLMQYWIDDEDTHAVGLYLESMGNPRKFSRIARNLGIIKPVIVVQSGVSAFGVPPGHRVRKTKARPTVFTAMLRQAGAIRVSNVHQMFDVAQLLVHQPLPAGRRVAIVGNSSALGALSAGAVAGRGLNVTHGPVNLPTEATARQFREALDKAFADPDVDSVLACFIPPIVAHDEEVTEAVRSAARGSEKTCVATFLGMRGVDSSTSMEEGGGSGQAIPIYAMPEDAAYALAKATKYAQWRNKDHGVPVAPAGINRRVAEDVVHTVLSVSPEGRRLDPDETAALLAAYGIEVWPSRRVATVDEAVEAAGEIGYPVVLKSTAPMLRHQGGVTGVRVDLANDQAVRDAWASLHERLSPLAAGELEVQRMATPGVACVVTADEDPLFGPVVSFGVSGLPTELLDDIAHRIPPLTDVAVSELISSVKAAPVLHGHRGSTPVHRAALADLIARVSVMSDDMPELVSLRLNPVNAQPGGVEVLGAEVTVAPVARRTDPGRRSLT
ncbi:multidrug ABC transporter permease [Knoellia sinensis KCTC 19936]|uniref:Multidrug ABC transporter permease n=1 Tax=Knoellia sinensis KCTC 19936 TaxID=1385520 RepID=A0A0A0J764_9MICO|nr:bifunctional GNAT family N-acetyltransferase/acetate--CoA ligase family protein [Knoellia sinensis]KGN33225.1 multidrug ABC transporter permease [Knoellia sinensis KCTC 19936]